jgi:hypothetical protein
LPNRWKPISLVWLFCLLLFLYGAYFRPASWFGDRTDLGQFTGKVWQREITAGIFDYLPKWSAMPPGSAAPSDVTVKEPVTVRTLTKTSNLQVYTVNNPTRRTNLLIINTFYYPGWVGELDGRPVTVAVTHGDLGLMQLVIPPGRHQLILHFGETTLRLTADGLSLVSWGILLLFLIGRTPFWFRIRPKLDEIA